MEYRVISVTRVEKGDCCSNEVRASLEQEIQNACNNAANKGFVLVAIYPEDFIETDCGQKRRIHGALLVFGRKVS